MPPGLRRAAVTGALAAVVGLSGCGSATVRLDPKAIERAIGAAIHRQRGLDMRVTCPSAPRKAGEVFDCVASPGPQPGLPTYFEVTETDGAGHIHFLGLS